MKKKFFYRERWHFVANRMRDLEIENSDLDTTLIHAWECLQNVVKMDVDLLYTLSMYNCKRGRLLSNAIGVSCFSWDA